MSVCVEKGAHSPLSLAGSLKVFLEGSGVLNR